MSVLYVALPVALLLGGAALVACLLSIRSGQFDDLETPAVRMLIEDCPVNKESLPVGNEPSGAISPDQDHRLISAPVPDDRAQSSAGHDG